MSPASWCLWQLRQSRCTSRVVWRGRLYPRISLTSQILSFARRYLSDLRQPWCVSDWRNKQTATSAEGRDETARILAVVFCKWHGPRHFYVDRDEWSLVISWRHQTQIVTYMEVVLRLLLVYLPLLNKRCNIHFYSVSDRLLILIRVVKLIRSSLAAKCK